MNLTKKTPTDKNKKQWLLEGRGREVGWWSTRYKLYGIKEATRTKSKTGYYTETAEENTNRTLFDINRSNNFCATQG